MDRLRAPTRGRGTGDGLASSVLGALLLLLVSGGAARLLARGDESPPATERCGREHPGRGESVPLDLGALERTYAALKSDLALRLGEGIVDPEKAIRTSVDLGLPACRGSAERRIRLSAELPAAFRKTALLFLRAGSAVPESALQNPEAEILLVSAEGLGSVAELSRALGKRVTHAPPRLVQALGLRCAPTRVTFTEDGDHAILAEGE